MVFSNSEPSQMVVHTAVIRSDSVAAIFCGSYYSRAATIRKWLLFKEGVYFVGKPVDSNDN